MFGAFSAGTICKQFPNDNQKSYDTKIHTFIKCLHIVPLFNVMIFYTDCALHVS